MEGLRKEGRKEGRFTKCCACHEIWTSRFSKCCACHEICTSSFTKCCACQELCASRFTKRCTCHEIYTSRFTKCCACHEVCTSRFTKRCICHEICTSRFTKRCACREIYTSKFTKCCACHEICTIFLLVLPRAASTLPPQYNLWFFRRGRHFWHHGARFGQGKWKMCTSRFTKCCACPCHKSENEPHVQKSRFTAPVTTMSKVPRLPRKLHFDVKQLTKSRV